jgi:hypothetical protein
MDVGADTTARRRLIELARAHGVSPVAVPAFLVGDALIVGFDKSGSTEAAVRARLRAPGTRRDTLGGVMRSARAPPNEIVNIPLLGPLSASRVGLPLFSFIVGFVDGVNPCAMWALLYLLTLLATLHDRRKMLLIGGTFVAVGGVMYFAFIAAWLELFLWIGLSRAVQIVLGSAAVLAASVHVKDFFAFARGPTLSIPASARPTILRQARRIVTAENLVGALVAVILLSVLVNLVEMLCTAGLPAVYTQVLASHDLGRLGHYANLSVYVAAYVLDDAIVLGAGVLTLSHRRLQERAGRWLKLVSGVVLMALGLALLLRPDWLK